jgi:TfoX/Sxy family transcriptional regulator of competence genes
MAYDEALAERIRDLLAVNPDVTERKMFGGIGFMVAGNMCCGVLGDELVVRVGPEAGERALREPGVRAFDFTGRPAKGMLYVAPEVTGSEEGLAAWVEQALAHAMSLPPK